MAYTYLYKNHKHLVLFKKKCFRSFIKIFMYKIKHYGINKISQGIYSPIW